MLVKEIMTKKVLTVTEKTPFKKVATLIFKKRVSGVPVVNQKRELLGIISEKDLLSALYPSYEELFDELFHDTIHARDFNEIENRTKEALHFRAANLMKKNVIAVSPETHVMEACSKMILNRVRRLPVIDKGKLVGIVSQGDVFRAILKKELDLRR
jgi:CBS domain-containing protein